MSQQIEKLAVLFADICDSTALYDRVGDTQARHLTAWCIATMLHEITAFHGKLIKTIGDEIMCTFPSAKAALNAACAMQNAIRHQQPENNIAMHIRVGFHYGEVICEAGDVFGDTVNVAARVASLARTNQIMTTQAVYNALPLILQNETYQIMSAELKGKQEKYPIFLVIWEQGDIETTHFNAPPLTKAVDNVHELTLSYKDQRIKVNVERKSVMLGRGNNCDIIIHDSFASRQHVRVELHFDKFFIIDQSINGTYIRFSEGNTIHITREDMILHSSGYFSLGQNDNEFIEFSIGFSSVLNRV